MDFINNLFAIKVNQNRNHKANKVYKKMTNLSLKAVHIHMKMKNVVKQMKRMILKVKVKFLKKNLELK